MRDLNTHSKYPHSSNDGSESSEYFLKLKTTMDISREVEMIPLRFAQSYNGKPLSCSLFRKISTGRTSRRDGKIPASCKCTGTGNVKN